MKRGLGEAERRLFAYAQMRGRTIVRTGELRKTLALTPLQERNLLSRLARAGWIARVRRGLYLVPRTLPLGGKWSPDEILALNTLMEDVKGRYQICGPNAFNRYGFDEQVPARVYAYNNRISGERSVGAVRLALIKVADERLGGTEEVETRDGQLAVYASRARALVDAVYDWARFNSLPRGYNWIRGELEKKRVNAPELVDMTLRYGDVGTVRRIGMLLERAGTDRRLLRKLEKKLPKSTGLIPWIPSSPKRGSINRRWGVVVNAEA
ncbi:MAG: type IV toxin-antitoxin system AbiEi family antitoxin domain-containing protein [Betaproteobacteria bacterium]